MLIKISTKLGFSMKYLPIETKRVKKYGTCRIYKAFSAIFSKLGTNATGSPIEIIMLVKLFKGIVQRDLIGVKVVSIHWPSFNIEPLIFNF